MEHKSKTNDPSVQTWYRELGIAVTLGYPRNGMVLRLNVKGEGHRVNK